MTLLAPGGVICDDDSVSRRALSAILTRRGFSVFATVDSFEALLGAAGGVPTGVILLELALAGVGGLQVIPALRAVAPDCAIVLLSSFGNLRTAAIRAGAFDLVDPRDLRDLERCLDRLMVEREAGAQFPPPARSNGSYSPSTF